MKNFALITFFLLSIIAGKAQETFTDEELTTYASVMVWAEAEKSSMTDTYNDWIRNNETINTKLFSDIKKAKGDSVKIAALDVSSEDLVAFETIQTKYDSMTASFKDVYVGKIKEDIGAGLYNRLKKSLKSDTEVKERYGAIYEGLKSEESTEEGTE